MINENTKVVVGTRFWGSTPDDLARIVRFAEKCAEQAVPVVVAINVAQDRTDSCAVLGDKFPETPLPVQPWGKFVQPLNAIIASAIERHKGTHLLLASAEFPPTQAQIADLMECVDGDTLVVGARFAEHEYHPGKLMHCTGSTTPWNTFALWSLEDLSGIGFPLIGDSLLQKENAGVEEVATIALYQKLSRKKYRAKLVPVDGIGGQWNTQGWTAERHEKHRIKMAAKVSRPAAQLVSLGIEAGFVDHL